MATTARGHIEQLPSGSFRVHVYAGTDPVTGKPRRLKQTCPDEASAAAALGKLLAQADGDHFPNREATLGQALAKYLEVADLEVSTREAHQGYIRRTIGPVLGEVKIRKLGADSSLALHGPEEVLTAVSAAPAYRAPHGRRACMRRPVRPVARPPHHPSARVRRPLPSARVQADEARHDPARPLDHLLGPGPGRPLRLGRPQRRQERQPAASPEARARSAESGPGRPAAQSRLG